MNKKMIDDTKTLNGRIYTVNHISESRKTLKGGNKNE